MTHPGNSEYVLVPREPTREMRDALICLPREYGDTPFDNCETIWNAMLAAAPAITTWHRIDDPVKAALEAIVEQHATTPLEVGLQSDALLGRLLRCREIADAALSPLPPPPDEGG